MNNLETISPSQKGYKLSALTLIIAATLQVGAVQAEEINELDMSVASAESEKSYKVDRSTSEKYTQDLVDTPRTITVISEAVMKDRNVDNLRQALRNVPGISFAAGEGGAPTGDSMSIRGFNASNNLMIDGVRDIAGYNRDTYNVEAIEVAKGPGSAIYGRGGAGGVINLQTKSAKLDDFTDLSLRLGTESDYRAQVDGNFVVGETSALRVNVLADAGDVPGRDEVENSNAAIALAYTYGLSTDSRFSVNADYQQQDNMPDYGIPWVGNYSTTPDRVIASNLAAYEGGPAPVDFSNFYGNVYRDFEDIEGSSITLKYEKDLSAATQIRVLGRTGSLSRQSIVTAPRFTSTKVDDVTIYGADEEINAGGEKTRDTKNSMSVIQMDLVGQYELGGMTHDVVTGIEYSQEKFERWNYEDVVADNLEDLTVDLYNPDAHLPFTGQYARTDKSNESTGKTAAIYAFDTVTINPQWQITAGLRYDSFDTEYYYDLEGDGGDPSAKLTADEGVLSWNLGVVFKPSENGSIYVAAGNAFTPAAESLTMSTSGNAADLDPEETISYEIGTKWNLIDNNLLLSAAVFRTEKNNARTDDPFATDTSDETLDGKQEVTGLELSAVGQLTDDLSVTAAYTYQQSEVTEATGDDAVQVGQQLPRTPENSASVWVNYNITEKFDIGFGAEYMDDRYNSSDPGGREFAASYTLLDFMASYQVTDKFGLQFNSSNLADAKYADQLGGGHFVPGDGRYFSLTASYSF
ncbi:TonB-dependent siderophore receptor [Colwellia echini]|uniref:TonB-dependent siderophore receptor n=2 Tax=Colwellia echini TaxID=1982103 RepID=A0ABY3MV98_9GAMM|nr:TonB-dependent siderophore receptor [Colwellia echini]